MRKITFSLAIAATVINFAAAGTGRPVQEAQAQPIPSTTEPATQKTAYVEGIERINGHYVLSVDYIDWYEGAAATAIFRERESDPEVTEPPDGYYIVNDDTTLQTIELPDDALIQMQIYDRGGEEPSDIVPDETIKADKFATLVSKGEAAAINVQDFPYHLTIVNGRAVRVVQQFIP